MDELKPGQLVRSTAGRDAGKHYLVLKHLDSNRVLLVNGRSRPLSSPKKKNPLHLQTYDRQADVEKKLSDGELTDSQVIFLIREMAPTD